ncbi:MAG: Bug family tripartite tricarboxylate transporter substrate binding protein [Burkholderiales bacterium]
MKQTMVATLAASCLLPLTLHAAAPAYPDKPVRIIVPLAAGGGMDTTARTVATPLAARFNQNGVVDNRPGGGGSIGAEILKDSPRDGHTLMMGSTTLVIHPLLYKARYVPTKDFTAITQVTRQPYVLIVHPKIPAKTVSELVAFSKANPERINYASAGQGSIIHLTTELFKFRTGARMNHVPYKGMGAAYTDMLSGRIESAFASVISVLPHLRNNRLRALAVSSGQRAAVLPDIPTVMEAGVRDFDIINWYGLFAPAGTPRTIIDTLQREVAATLQRAEVRARMAGDGSEPVGNTPAAFSAHVKAESARYADVIKKSNIRAD